MRVSTFSFRFWMPVSACTDRRRPSKVNGRVTTPMVRAPRPLAISATTGAAPVPVPPPLPAVMKTMSAPFSASSISARCSSAARRPTSGSLPAPSPRVSWRPMSSFRSASLISSAWASVLVAMNSTPSEPGVDHPVDGIHPAAADADHLDDGEVVVLCRNGHGIPYPVDRRPIAMLAAPPTRRSIDCTRLRRSQPVMEVERQWKRRGHTIRAGAARGQATSTPGRSTAPVTTGRLGHGDVDDVAGRAARRGRGSRRRPRTWRGAAVVVPRYTVTAEVEGQAPTVRRRARTRSPSATWAAKARRQAGRPTTSARRGADGAASGPRPRRRSRDRPARADQRRPGPAAASATHASASGRGRGRPRPSRPARRIADDRARALGHRDLHAVGPVPASPWPWRPTGSALDRAAAARRVHVDQRRMAARARRRPRRRCGGVWTRPGHGHHPGTQNHGVWRTSHATTPGPSTTTATTQDGQRRRRLPATTAARRSDPAGAIARIPAAAGRAAAARRRASAPAAHAACPVAQVPVMAASSPGLFARSKPTMRTSGASTTPSCSATVGRTWSMRRRTSSADPPSSAWMKLACFVGDLGRPDPEALEAGRLDEPAGRVARRVGEHRAGVAAPRAGARVATGRSRRWLARPASPVAGRERELGPRTTSVVGSDDVPVAELEPVGAVLAAALARRRSTQRYAHQGGRGVRAVAAGVHPHRPADRAGHADRPLEPGQPGRDACGGPAPASRRARPRPGPGGPSMPMVGLEAGPEADGQTGEAAVGDQQVRALARRTSTGTATAAERPADREQVVLVGRPRRRARPGPRPGRW